LANGTVEPNSARARPSKFDLEIRDNADTRLSNIATAASSLRNARYPLNVVENP
jgi:hypothetical protein